MKTIKLFCAAVIAAATIVSCNVDNADSPANTVTQADTTTTNPQGLTFDPGVNPAAINLSESDSTVNDTSQVLTR